MNDAPTATVGWRAAQRATPWLANAIAGGAGVLISIGVIAFGIDLYPHHSHGPGWAGFAFCIVAVAVGLVLINRLPTLFESAGVAMVAIGIVAAMAFVQLPRVNEVADLRLFFAVSIVAWLVAFAVGPAKARPLLLALALLAGLVWATIEVADLHANSDFLFGVRSSIGRSDTGSDSGSGSGAEINGFTVGPDGSLTPNDSFTPGDSGSSSGFEFGQPESHGPDYGALGEVSLGFGAVYLIGVAVLDARGRRGIATAVVIPAVVAMIDTVVFLSQKTDNIVVAGLLSLAAGLSVGAVGASARRRFMVWIGAFGATVGAVILTGKASDSAAGSSNSHAGSVFGAFTIVFGVAMILVAVLAARVLHEPSTGDAPSLPAPEPVPATATTPPVPPAPPAPL